MRRREGGGGSARRGAAGGARRSAPLRPPRGPWGPRRARRGRRGRRAGGGRRRGGPAACPGGEGDGQGDGLDEGEADEHPWRVGGIVVDEASRSRGVDGHVDRQANPFPGEELALPARQLVPLARDLVEEAPAAACIGRAGAVFREALPVMGRAAALADDDAIHEALAAVLAARRLFEARNRSGHGGSPS